MRRNTVTSFCGAGWLALAAGVVGCQDYEFIFQPNDDREGSHLRFIVEQPSKADILFVIDNSRGMRPKQSALKASIGKMVDFLAPLDTSYRIGVISTDAQGFADDCNGEPITEGSDDQDLHGNQGNCGRCWCVMDGTTRDCDNSNDCTLAFGNNPAETCNTNLTAHDGTSQGRCSIDCEVDPGCSGLGLVDCGNRSECDWVDVVDPGIDYCDYTSCPGGWQCNTTATPFDNAYDGRCYSAGCKQCRNYCNAGVDPDCASVVKLRRPHDGAKGRLIAAYDPAVFDIDAVDDFGQPLYPEQTQDAAGTPKPLFNGDVRTVLTDLFFTPPEDNPALKVPWIIDRETIRQEACDACLISDDCDDVVEDNNEGRDECCAQSRYDLYHADTCAAEVECGTNLTCGREGTCTTFFEDCALPVAQGLFTAYFQSNVNGLGTDGQGYEEGTKTALMAVGINPLDTNDATALDPGSKLLRPRDTRPAGANTYVEIDAGGTPVDLPWLRDDALLAVMFVTDEEDCSMPVTVWDGKRLVEKDQGEPPGSLCYQSQINQSFVDTARMHDLLLQKKKGSESRLTVGLIGSVEPNGQAPKERRSARAVDCVVQDVPVGTNPSTDCACLSSAADPSLWCKYSTLDAGGGRPSCDGMAGRRYIAFANDFKRKTFDSICRGCPSSGTCEAYGEALIDFARLATLACFELGDIRPAGCSEQRLDLCAGKDQLIEVRRASAAEIARAEEAGEDPVMTLLARLDGPEDPNLPEDGGAWFYDAGENLICLVDLDRSIGDAYDIFVLHRDEQSFSF